VGGETKNLVGWVSRVRTRRGSVAYDEDLPRWKGCHVDFKATVNGDGGTWSFLFLHPGIYCTTEDNHAKFGQVGRKEIDTVLIGCPKKPADFNFPSATVSGQNNVKVNCSLVMLEIKKN
jgi:hypothetical protein